MWVCVCGYSTCSYAGRLTASFEGNVAICSLPVLVFSLPHSLSECVFVQCSFNLQFILIVFCSLCVCARDSESLFALAFQKKKKRICGKCSRCSHVFLLTRLPFNLERSYKSSMAAINLFLCVFFFNFECSRFLTKLKLHMWRCDMTTKQKPQQWWRNEFLRWTRRNEYIFYFFHVSLMRGTPK